jgi:hypothetical protein
MGAAKRLHPKPGQGSPLFQTTVLNAYLVKISRTWVWTASTSTHAASHVGDSLSRRALFFDVGRLVLVCRRLLE